MEYPSHNLSFWVQLLYSFVILIKLVTKQFCCSLLISWLSLSIFIINLRFYNFIFHTFQPARSTELASLFSFICSNFYFWYSSNKVKEFLYILRTVSCTFTPARALHARIRIKIPISIRTTRKKKSTIVENGYRGEEAIWRWRFWWKMFENQNSLRIMFMLTVMYETKKSQNKTLVTCHNCKTVRSFEQFVFLMWPVQQVKRFTTKSWLYLSSLRTVFDQLKWTDKTYNYDYVLLATRV